MVHFTFPMYSRTRTKKLVFKFEWIVYFFFNSSIIQLVILTFFSKGTLNRTTNNLES